MKNLKLVALVSIVSLGLIGCSQSNNTLPSSTKTPVVQPQPIVQTQSSTSTEKFVAVPPFQYPGFTFQYDSSRFALVSGDGNIVKTEDVIQTVIDNGSQNNGVGLLEKGKKLDGMNTDYTLYMKFLDLTDIKSVGKSLYGKINKVEDVAFGKRYTVADQSNGKTIIYYVKPDSKKGYYEIAIYKNADQVQDVIDSFMAVPFSTPESWTLSYTNKTSKGLLALQFFKDFREKQTVSGDVALDLYRNKGLTDIMNVGAFAEGCLPPDGSDNTPGIQSVEIYSVDKNFKDGKYHSFYLSLNMHTDTQGFGNNYPLLYGPYQGVASEVVDSFSDLACPSR